MTTNKTFGSLFYYQVVPPHDYSKIRVDADYLMHIKVDSVRKLLENISIEIKNFELSESLVESQIKGQIKIIDDITYSCVLVGKWRRGFAYLYLQLSEKNGGALRLSAYTTNTIHHTAECFGTIPDIDDVKILIGDYLREPSKILNDIVKLRICHSTKKEVKVLLDEMIY